MKTPIWLGIAVRFTDHCQESRCFFFGILMAVANLGSLGILFIGAESLKTVVSNIDIVMMAFGVGSAVIYKLSLVAASMGMFNGPMDDYLWNFVLFSAGTGKSVLIIGSFSGLVVMGMEKINFMRYFKNIARLAAKGFVGWAIAFLLIGNINL